MSGDTAKVPKAVLKLAASQPKDATTIDLESATQKERTAVLNAFYYTTPKGDPKRKEYTDLNSDAERRQWLGTWAMAASQGKSKGWNSSTVSTKSREKESEVWLTKEMLASSQYLNSTAHADIYVKTATARAFKDNTALADAGVLEYLYVQNAEIRERERTSTAGVKTEADLTAEEYDEVAASMQQALEVKGPPAKKAKTTTPKKFPHQVWAKLTAAKRGKDQALRKIKEHSDKILVDLDRVDGVSEKLAKKGWPKALQDMLQSSAEKVRTSCEANATMWGKEIMDAVVRLPGDLSGKEHQLEENQVRGIEAIITDIDTKTAELDKARKALESEHKAFCSGTLADMVKIS